MQGRRICHLPCGMCLSFENQKEKKRYVFLARVQLLFFLFCLVISFEFKLSQVLYLFTCKRKFLTENSDKEKKPSCVWWWWMARARYTHVIFSSKMVIWPIFVFWLGYFWMILLLVVSSVNSFFCVCRWHCPQFSVETIYAFGFKSSFK